MNANIILAPILIHLITAVISLFLWGRVLPQKILSLIGSLLVLISSVLIFFLNQKWGSIIVFAGNWKPPYGITFVTDTLSTIMLLLTAIVGLAVSIYSHVAISTSRIKFGYYPIYHFLLMGLSGAFLTGDIFNMYVWFEVVIISSFVLLTLGGKRMQMEGAVKYMAINMLASIIFLTGIGILYGLTGSLNIADIGTKVRTIENQGLVQVTSLLFFFGFGIKSAVFPLYFWLPSSYHTPPSAIAAIFGGLLTKMGIYSLLRVFTVIFYPDNFMLNFFCAIAIMTMITGALGAMNKKSLRRMFSYLIVCHIGYLIAGIGLYTELAISGVIFYLIHDIIIKSNLFMMTGIIYKIRASTDMRRLGGLYKDYPKLSFVMAIILFSLIGIPPLSGFWAKIPFITESIHEGRFVLLAVILFSSFVTLIIISKLWSEVFWKDLPKPNPTEIDKFAPLKLYEKISLVFPVLLLASITLYIGLNAGAIIKVTDKVAYELLHPDIYIESVLGKN
ncbi:MAG TPA: proton-conducting transporter membrane subunit [Chitinophagales bacterium]|nr:proton-conducting transporter membrane subunit [Chitinophagales bacterium]